MPAPIVVSPMPRPLLGSSSRLPATAKGFTRLLPPVANEVRIVPALGSSAAAQGWNAIELSMICCLAKGVQLEVSRPATL